MGYAFISYSSKNQASADAMRMLFKKHNIDTWMAPYDIPVGSEYAEVLCEALSGCSCLVLMLTDISQNSQWVKKEVNIAISNGKTIIPVKLEDIELNSTMKFYLNDQQIIPVHTIEESSEELQKVLDSVVRITGQTISNDVIIDVSKCSIPINNSRSKQIRVTIWSPVNTDVYLNDKKHLIMRIDCNSGFDYKSNIISISDDFELIFVSKGFEKVISFDLSAIDNVLEYNLKAILSEREIILSYDRNEAIEQIKVEATAYAYEQLSKVGIEEDIPLLCDELKRLSAIKNKNHHINYLIAVCASSLEKIAAKFNMEERISSIIIQIYENYEAKSSYGYMFDSIVKSSESERYSDSHNLPKKNSGNLIDESYDEFIKEAMRIFISLNNASVSILQRKLGLGYSKASKIMDILFEKGYIYGNNSHRKILMTKEQFKEVFGEDIDSKK